MAESSSTKRETETPWTQEKRQKGFNNFDDAFVSRLTVETRKKYFGEESSKEDKEERKKEKDITIIYPTVVSLPEYNLCITPVSKEEQKQKGLYTELPEPPSFEMPYMPFSSPTKEGEIDLFALSGEELLAALKEEEEKTTPTPTPTPFPRISGKPTLLFQQPAKVEIRCRSGEILSPYCQCSLHPRCSPSYSRIQTLTFVPRGALDEHRPHFLPIWLAYKLQMRQSHCFDIDDHPGSGEIAPLPPFVDFNSKDGVPLELANLAIKEYNEKESNVHKYKVLKIEKVNHSSCLETFKYWMTVKVLNLTLVTPIETFHIHAALRIGFDEKVIYCCQPKKEVNVGFPCCDVCFGKLDK